MTQLCHSWVLTHLRAQVHVSQGYLDRSVYCSQQLSVEPAQAQQRRNSKGTKVWMQMYIYAVEG